MTIRNYSADPGSCRLPTNYTLQVSVKDADGKICITSPDVPGLLIYGDPREALADVPAAVSLCRALNCNISQPRSCE